MLRYFGCVFIATMAAILAAGVAIILLGGLAERLSLTHAVRLTALDEVARVSPAKILLRGVLEDIDRRKRVPNVPLVFRLEDGWVGAGTTSRRGVARSVRHGGLPPGRYRYEVRLPETHPRLGGRGSGTVWVGPADVPVIWVDASAVMAVPAGGRRPSRASGPAPSEVEGSSGPWAFPERSRGVERQPEVLEALKTLAATHRLVYVVATDLGEYEPMRRGLEAAGCPAGPAVWADPGAEWRTLAPLKNGWPRVHAALVASHELAQAVRKRGVDVWRVAEADGSKAVPEEGVLTWSEVLGRAAGRQPGTDAGREG